MSDTALTVLLVGGAIAALFLIPLFQIEKEKRKRYEWSSVPGCVFRSKSAGLSEQTGRPFGVKQATVSEQIGHLLGRALDNEVA